MTRDHFRFFSLCLDFFSNLSRTIPRNGGDAFWIIPPITYDEVLGMLCPKIEEVDHLFNSGVEFSPPLYRYLHPKIFGFALHLAFR